MNIVYNFKNCKQCRQLLFNFRLIHSHNPFIEIFYILTKMYKTYKIFQLKYQNFIFIILLISKLYFYIVYL